MENEVDGVVVGVEMKCYDKRAGCRAIAVIGVNNAAWSYHSAKPIDRSSVNSRR